jgi:drug/metabolite transporter (DMT)-like permease
MQSRGVLFMILSALGFSLMSLLVKLAAETLPTGEIVFGRAVMTLALSYWMLRRANLSPWGVQRRKLVTRGLFGAVALAAYFVSLVRLPLADASTLHQTQPLITAVLAWWLIGERVGWASSFAIVCGFAGVMLVVHPGIPLGDGADPLGVAIALASAVCSSFSYITIRQLSRSDHPLVIVFYFPLIAAPLSLPWALYDFVLPSATGWLLLVGIGVTTQFGQVFMTKALVIESAARAMSIGYSQIVFASILQIVVYGMYPALGTILGGALVIAGTLAVSMTAKPAAEAARTPT